MVRGGGDGMGDEQVSLMFPFLSHSATSRLLRWSTFTAGMMPAVAVVASKVAREMLVRYMVGEGDLKKL